MLEKLNSTAEKRQIFNAILIPCIIGIFMILSFVLEKGMGWDFHSAGVYPRQVGSIWGIFTLIFVHADWSHLINNVISFVILCSFLCFFYKTLATRVLLISYIVSGLILWIIGRESWHIGASGLIYALAFFLFLSGIIRQHIPLISISLIVALIYGNMIWHVFPWETHDSISWEGHLAGGLVGSFLAVYYRNEGSQKPVAVWEEEDDSIEYMSDEEDDNEISNI